MPQGPNVDRSANCDNNSSKTMPVAFREALCWSTSNPKKPVKRTGSREHVPAVVTCDEWNNMFRRKAEEKQAQEEQKPLNKVMREKKKELREQELAIAQAARKIKQESMAEKKKEEPRAKENRKMEKARATAEKKQKEEELKLEKKKARQEKKLEKIVKDSNPTTAKAIKQEIVNGEEQNGLNRLSKATAMENPDKD